MRTVETDYLVVGAGATGMAFTDALVTESDARVVLVDRRNSPGGHWNDAYPFVRLHQPSAFYGVNSRRLGNDTIDQTGPNAGFYERATAAEICDYYQRVLDEQLLGSGQVRFYGMSEYVLGGPTGHRVICRVTGAATAIAVRGKLVNATYAEQAVPATHTPSFGVEPGARVAPPSELVRLAEPAEGYTVLGSGKTAMDTCIWLLEHGVAPQNIRWIRPRDPWLVDRARLQPLDQVASTIEGVSLDLESAALAEDADDLFDRLEACGQLHRLDPDVTPRMFHGPIVSEAERVALRRIERVVRDRVVRLEADRIILEQGTTPTKRGELHIDCTAGLARVAPRPIFEPGRITPQLMRLGQAPFNAALVGFMESTGRDDAEKNRLCPPNPLPRVDSALDWAWATAIATRAEMLWGEQPDVSRWISRARVNVARGLEDHFDEPRMQEALTRLLTHREAAIANLERLIAQEEATASPVSARA